MPGLDAVNCGIPRREIGELVIHEAKLDGEHARL